MLAQTLSLSIGMASSLMYNPFPSFLSFINMLCLYFFWKEFVYNTHQALNEQLF